MRNFLRRALHSPALGLYFLAPLVAEFFLGDFPIVLIPLLIPLSLWYGGGVLLIREVARRHELGWPSILLLGLAFAVVEEGLLTMSLFDPDYADQRLLDPGHVSALGIGIPWTVFVLTIHVGWSVATPIAVMETAQPGRRTDPWLSRRGLFVVAGVTVAGAGIVFATNYPAYGHFIAAPGQLASCLVIAVIAVAGALRLPGGRRATATSSGADKAVVRPITVLAVTLLCAGVFHLGRHAAVVVSIPVMLASIVGLLTALARWSSRPGWDHRHVFAAAAGMLLTYSWRAFTAGYGSGTSDLIISLLSYVVYAAAAIAILVACRRRMDVRPEVQLSV